ncbi:hypothetical protein 035JT004_110 [Bacillus phage 035JT004]|nr:hypothetical protein 035JT004_110 [Bacillus phage 035JT004]
MSKRKNRELAVKLLSSTTKSYRQISSETGISSSTVAYMAKKHRPDHLINPKGRRPKHESDTPTIQIDFSEEQQSVITPLPDSIPVRRDSEGAAVSLNLKVEEQLVSKEAAAQRLEGALQILKMLPGDQVSLSMKLEQ